ncbi:hypothetical protein [Subtercola sp. RTI3]|uniref:hypothetical protein n=1 Tax=Subtercola sp. RTI3 TaxID=3048639 RepID=UPI002B23846F|nr:hypothetical protein [Subtercola sp. RTI3]MEA9983656.1 hypothetical protein [Subtercola sp. RTI3]
MVQYPQSSLDYYQQQQSIAGATAASIGKLWRQMGSDFDPSWKSLRPQIADVLRVGRLAAVATSAAYLPAVLAETGQSAPTANAIIPEAFVEFTPAGGLVNDLLDTSVTKAKVAVGSGRDTQSALAQAGRWLTGTTLTILADTGRSVAQADMGARPAISGYVRMLNAPSCSRCIILAGKWFRWNSGFLRHPRCDCRHIPASEDTSGDLRTDPYAYFHSLSNDDQTKLFGRIEARSIRDGGDIYRVENLRARGLGTVKSNAQYGTPHKMSIDDIYRTAGTRTNAVKMMEQNGYITGPQIRGGNIIGTGPAAQGFGQLGKGGKARAASNAVLDANATGIRDPLNRYTMTAAERRLFDSKARLDIANTGILPRSIGENSADKYSKPQLITPLQRQLIQDQYDLQLAKVADSPASVQRLARAMGVF